MFNIHMLPASFGDSMLIEYGPEGAQKYILIDGGPFYQFDEILAVLEKKVPQMKEIELLVVTHVDIDHIDGIVKLINHDPPLYKINKVWFNNYEDLSYQEPSDLLGGVQGEFFNILVEKRDLKKNLKPITIHSTESELEVAGGMVLTVVNPTQKDLSSLRKAWEKHLKKKKLSDDPNEIWEALNNDYRYDSSPDDLLGEDEESIEAWAGKRCKEDKSPANKSSIAFIASYGGRTCLMAADATSENLRENLKSLDLLDEFDTLSIDAWKLSHHGSKKSTQDYLMKIIQAKKIIVSSDGKRYRHPDKETIAKLLTHQRKKLDIYFNYTSAYNKEWGSMDLGTRYQADFHYPEEEGYACIKLLED